MLLHSPTERRKIPIGNLPKKNTLHVYCDGSAPKTGRAGCGILVRKFTNRNTNDVKIGLRLSDSASSTHAELVPIMEGLKEVRGRNNHTYFFVDSRDALESLTSRSPLYDELVCDCKKIIHELAINGYSI